MKKTLLFLFLVITAVCASAQSLSGKWSGKLNLGNSALTIVFNISEKDGKSVCTLDSPDQGAFGINSDITITGGTKVKINIPAIGGAYSGEVKDGLLKGTFVQSGMSFPLDLNKKAEELKRLQTPVPPYPYKTEDVKITTSDPTVTLSGTLTLPVGYEKMKKSKVPVVVMVTGSGPQNRDEELFGHKPFLVLADYLARNGIASLRYDDRGTAESTGQTANATTDDFMNDAAAVINYVRGSKRFGRCGVLGHSEGGLIAFMLGAAKKVDFIVSLAGTGVRGDNILTEQVRNTLVLQGLPKAEIDDFCNAMSKVYQAAVKVNYAEKADETVAAILKESKGQVVKTQADMLKAVITKCDPWTRFFMAFDPSADIKATQCPVFALNGSLDTQVLAKTNLSAIRRLLPKNKKNVIKEYPGLNHLFQHCTTGQVNEYRQIEETISPEVLKDIAGWINKL